VDWLATHAEKSTPPQRVSAKRSETPTISTRTYRSSQIGKLRPNAFRSLAPDIRQPFQQNDVGIALGNRGQNKAPV
jgi:hypothetical protein